MADSEQTPPPLLCPPPLPVRGEAARRIRHAHVLNLVVPGAGQWYLGQRVVGGLFVVTFLACFVAMIALFFVGYLKFMRTALRSDILAGNVLEELQNAFHLRWLLALLAIAILLYIVGAVGVFVYSRTRAR
jgi:uncharacterized membrane protein